MVAGGQREDGRPPVPACERGGDRGGTASLGALVPGDEVRLSGTWRP